MNAHDELERQLADSVAERARVRRAAAIGGLGRWWRAHVGQGGLALATSVLAIALAIGAPALSGHAGPAREQASLSDRHGAGFAEGPCPPCRAVGGRLHGPLSEAEQAGGPGARAPREVLVRNGIPTVLW